MGQNSSVEEKSKLKKFSNKRFLIDASESYITDVRLKSTVIPIAEYIRKEKYSRNIEKLDDVKQRNKELGKKAQKEDEPNRNRIINNNRGPDLKISTIHTCVKDTNSKCRSIQTLKSPPKLENKYQQRNASSKLPQHSTTVAYDTNTCKKYEKSTHCFSNHPTSIATAKLNRNRLNKKPNRLNLVVQTHLACTIPPLGANVKQQPPKELSHYKNVVEELEDKFTKHPPPFDSPAVSAGKLEIIAKQHRHNFSAKQALENWKNIHTLRQHRKQQQNIQEIDTILSPKLNYANSSAAGTAFDEYPQQRKDFSDIERCLKQQIKRRSGGQQPRQLADKKTTWVQDKHRRWHKLCLDEY